MLYFTLQLNFLFQLYQKMVLLKRVKTKTKLVQMSASQSGHQINELHQIMSTLILKMRVMDAEMNDHLNPKRKQRLMRQQQIMELAMTRKIHSRKRKQGHRLDRMKPKWSPEARLIFNYEILVDMFKQFID